MRKTMNFEEFKNEVVSSITRWLPDTFGKAEVSVDVVTKTNGVKLTGLLIRRANSMISPMIYLESFYKAYENGEEMDQILQRIAKARMDHDATDIADVNMITEYSDIQDRIMPRIIGAKWNKDLLKGRPHKMVEDLSVVFILDMGMSDDGLMTIPVTNEMSERWGVSADDLYETAVKNLEKTEGVFVSMFEMLSDIIGIESPQEMIPDGYMYVLTNKTKIFGSSMLLSKKMMKKVIEKVGKDFFVIPSSVHEVIIVNDRISVSDMENMVRDVNENEVAVLDRLSDHVYRYSEEGGLVTA